MDALKVTLNGQYLATVGSSHPTSTVGLCLVSVYKNERQSFECIIAGMEGHSEDETMCLKWAEMGFQLGDKLTIRTVDAEVDEPKRTPWKDNGQEYEA